MGQTLFGSYNPVHTGGPMQVSIAFAEQHAKGYPWKMTGTVRQEVFTAPWRVVVWNLPFAELPGELQRACFPLRRLQRGMVTPAVTLRSRMPSVKPVG